MGWVNMPAAAGADWAALSFRLQFVEAIRERRFALGPNSYYGATWGGTTMPVVGNLAAKGYGLSYAPGQMQEIVSNMAPYFCPPGDYAGTVYGVGDYPRYTLAGLWAAAGINAGGFTRKYPREITTLAAPGELGWRARLTFIATPTGFVYYEYGTAWEPAEDQTSDPDLLTAYGYAETGDHIGSWLFNELRACLDLLTCMARQVGVNAYTVKGGSYGDGHASWAAALAAYPPWWAAMGDPDEGTGGGYPEAWCDAWHSPGYWKINNVNRKTTALLLSYRPDAELGHLSCDAAFYVTAGKCGQSLNDTFNNNGDNVADGTATLAEELISIDAGQTTIESALFPAGVANVATVAPVEPAEDEGTSTGYIVNNAFVVMDFAVAGGFEYVAGV